MFFDSIIKIKLTHLTRVFKCSHLFFFLPSKGPIYFVQCTLEVRSSGKFLAVQILFFSGGGFYKEHVWVSMGPVVILLFSRLRYFIAINALYIIVIIWESPSHSIMRNANYCNL
jgi:hypothetical protein